MRLLIAFLILLALVPPVWADTKTGFVWFSETLPCQEYPAAFGPVRNPTGKPFFLESLRVFSGSSAPVEVWVRVHHSNGQIIEYTPETTRSLNVLRSYRTPWKFTASEGLAVYLYCEPLLEGPAPTFTITIPVEGYTP